MATLLGHSQQRLPAKGGRAAFDVKSRHCGAARRAQLRARRAWFATSKTWLKHVDPQQHLDLLDKHGKFM